MAEQLDAGVVGRVPPRRRFQNLVRRDLNALRSKFGYDSDQLGSCSVVRDRSAEAGKLIG
jgi:hypothetical protein